MNKTQLLKQFLKYMVGGGVFFWSGLGIFSLLYLFFEVHWLVAKIIADVIGWTLNYLIQRYWAFQNPRLAGHTERIVRRYLIINIIDFALDYIIVSLFVRAGFTPYLGMVVSAWFTTVWDYLWYRFWVFKPDNS